mgnify:FL=1|tara:strand:+ start:1473 stop:2474 length:1002 start_codon:yes stop_codon:yes gene_type:complete
MKLKYYAEEQSNYTKNYAYFLDGTGSGKKILIKDIESFKDKKTGFLWISLDYTLDESKDILEKLDIDEFAVKLLTEEETRPRSIIFNDFILTILRGINLTPGHEPEDMVSVRIYLDKNKIITTRRRKLLSFHDLRHDILNHKAPKTTSEFLVTLNYKLLNRIDDAVESVDADLDVLEDLVSDADTLDCRAKIADLRREAILIKRYISPQKDALGKLYLEEHRLLTQKDRLYLRECIDKLQRCIEDLDSFRDRASVIHEELNNKINEDMNNKLFFLSLIAIIFLPITFLTGLLGVNLNGIPGATEGPSFWIFCGILLFIIALTMFVLYKIKWFK